MFKENLSGWFLNDRKRHESHIVGRGKSDYDESVGRGSRKKEQTGVEYESKNQQLEHRRNSKLLFTASSIMSAYWTRCHQLSVLPYICLLDMLWVEIVIARHLVENHFIVLNDIS